MSQPDLMSLAIQERADLLALLQTLAPAHWEAPTLCSKWRVRDVAIHIVSYEELSKAALAGAFLRGGLRVDTINQIALNRHQSLDSDGIIALVARSQRPRGLTAAMKGGIALTDGTIHHQDIRRALGMPRTIPQERLAPVLDFSLRAPTLPAKKNQQGLELIATDLDWSHGDGPQVRGPGEALLMALAGRAQALDELEGEGFETLRQRLA